MVSRRTRVASWIFRRDHPSRPKAMICCFFSSFKTFSMLREATYPPAAVNVLDISSESMAAFQVFLYGRFWVFTEVQINTTTFVQVLAGDFGPTPESFDGKPFRAFLRFAILILPKLGTCDRELRNDRALRTVLQLGITTEIADYQDFLHGILLN